MPFFQVDDQLQVNPKATALFEPVIHGDITGAAALGLWTMAGSVAQAAGTDGLISETQLFKILLNREAVTVLADVLIENSLWHGPGHDCTDCPEVPAGHYTFHQWFQFGYDTGEDNRLDRAKKKELKSESIAAAAWARDSTDGTGKEAQCRYCGDLVKRADRKGPKRPEKDHVDPGLAIGAENIVICCAECNRQKGKRTPEQAGLTLRPAPARVNRTAEVEPNLPTGRRTDPSASSGHGAEQPPHHRLAGVEPNLPTGRRTDPPASAGDMSAAPEQRGRPPGGSNRDQTGIRPDIKPGSDLISADRAMHGPARGQAGFGRAGSGQGEAGQGQAGSGGDGQGGAAGSGASRRKRRRRRGRRAEDEVESREPVGRAGAAPVVKGQGRFGSPWHGWQGPPSSVEDTTCVDHGLEMPCRKCSEEWIG